jgi:hypothetical protein
MRQEGLWAVGEDGGDCKDLLEGKLADGIKFLGFGICNCSVDPFRCSG